MRIFRTALVTFLLAVGLTLVGGAPALACSCALQTVAQYAQDSDVVFAGTLSQVEEPTGIVLSSDEDVVYTFAVDTVFAGDPAPDARVASALSGASCGLDFLDEGQRYVVFATVGEDDGLDASLCGGTGPATAQLENRVLAALGPGRLPDPTATTGGGSPPGLPSPFTPWLWLAGAIGVLAPFWWFATRRTEA